ISHFVEIAKILELPEANNKNRHEIATAVKNWLANEKNRNWLLVLDNADFDGTWTPHKLRKLLPPNPAGKFLITSRNSNLRGLGITKPIEIDAMTIEQSVEFFQLYLAQQFPSHSPVEIESARLLAQELDGLPLALQQAISGIAAEGLKFSTYLNRYQKREQEELDRYADIFVADSLDDLERSKASSTWQLNFEAIEHQSPASIQLLEQASFLAPDDLHLLIFSPTWNLVLSGKDSEFSDALEQWTKRLLSLHEYSLIQWRRGSEVFHIHRVVQSALRRHLQQQGRLIEILKSVAALLCATFPSDNFENWSRCESVLPHVRHYLKYADEHNINTLDMGLLLLHISSYLRQRAQYSEAEHFCMRALTLFEPRADLDESNTAAALNALSLIYDSMGRYREAVKPCEDALAIRRRIQSVPQDIATNLDNLAGLYRHLAKYKEAHTAYTEALEIRRKHLGDEHPDTAETINNVGTVHFSCNEFDESIHWFEQALKIREKSLLQGHPGLGESYNNLAITYLRVGKDTEAENYARQAVEVRMAALGQRHPDVAQSINNLGTILSKQMRWNEALEAFASATQLSEQASGPQHPHTALYISNLADVYAQTQRYEEALPLLQRAYDIYLSGFGSEHPSTLKTFQNLQEVRYILDQKIMPS
nr:tetratricopeptide repeat protein [Nostoc sp. CHAB 5824]